MFKNFRCLESKVLSKPSFLTRITLKHIQRVASQGVKYIEFYWNWTGLKHFMTYDEARQAINEGIRQGMQRYGVTARSIPSIDREDTPEAAVELVEEMTKHPDDYTIGSESIIEKPITNRKTSGKLSRWPKRQVSKSPFMPENSVSIGETLRPHETSWSRSN